MTTKYRGRKHTHSRRGGLAFNGGSFLNRKSSSKRDSAAGRHCLYSLHSHPFVFIIAFCRIKVNCLPMTSHSTSERVDTKSCVCVKMQRFKVKGPTGPKKLTLSFEFYKYWPLWGAAETVCALNGTVARKKTRPSGQIRPVRFNPDLPVVPSQLLISFASIFLDSDPLEEFTWSEITLLFCCLCSVALLFSM